MNKVECHRNAGSWGARLRESAISLAIWGTLVLAFGLNFANAATPTTLLAFEGRKPDLSATLTIDASTDGRGVAVNLGGTKFRIPAEFGVPIHRAQEPKDTYLVLWLLLPEFRPLKSSESWKNVGWERRLYVSVSLNPNLMSDAELEDYHIKGATPLPDAAEAPGFHRFKGRDWAAKDLFKSDDPEHPLIVACDEPRAGIRPACTIDEHYKESIVIHSVFRREFLPIAVNIDRRVRQLIESFEDK
jgi:hypothetical protein